MSLVDRPRPRAKTVRDTLRRFTNVLVWLPRDELSSQRRREIGDLATGLVDGVLDGWTSMMGEDPLVSLRYIIRHERNREDRKSTRLNSIHSCAPRLPSSA